MYTQIKTDHQGPYLIRKHTDGPYVIQTDGQLRWLNWMERISLFFGVLPKEFRK